MRNYNSRLFKWLKDVITIPDDTFIRRLRATVIGEGMLHEGNIYLIDKAIKNMPQSGYVVEIGVYGGLSTNLILHLLKKNNKPHIMVGCDAWIYEGYSDHKGRIDSHIDGRNDIERTAYMQYIKNAYINAVKMLSPNNLPFTCHLKSDEFFEKWNKKEELIDVFGRPFKLEDKIAFCYIDGDHSFEQTKADFKNVSQHLLKGGYILIDDSAKHLDFGSAHFIDEIKKLDNFKIVESNPNYLVQKIK